MSRNIEVFIQSEGIKLLEKIPFDKIFVQAIQNSKSIIEYDHTYENRFKAIWNNIRQTLLN